MELKEVYQQVNSKLEDVNFSLIWKDFQKYPFALYNKNEVCIDGNLIPWDDRFLGNTSIEYQGKNIAIWNIEKSYDLDILCANLVHEMFHCYQKDKRDNRFPNDFIMLDYPDDIVNYSLKYEENKLLVNMLNTNDETIKNQLLTQFASIRNKRKQIIGDFIYQEFRTETFEGSAEFVALKTMQQISPIKFQEQVQKYCDILLKPSELYFDIRRISYFVGALFLLALDNNLFDYDLFTEETHFDLLTKNCSIFDIKPKINSEIQVLLDKYLKNKECRIREFLNNENEVIENEYLIVGYDPMNMIKFHNQILCLHFVFLKDEKTNETKFYQGPILLNMKSGQKVSSIVFKK